MKINNDGENNHDNQKTQFSKSRQVEKAGGSGNPIPEPVTGDVSGIGFPDTKQPVDFCAIAKKHIQLSIFSRRVRLERKLNFLNKYLKKDTKYRKGMQIPITLLLLFALPLTLYAFWNAPSPTVVDNSGNVGQYATSAMVNGRPAISYIDQANHDLKYVCANDATGTSWDTPVVVDNSGWIGDYASLTVVNNRPAISYFDNTMGALRYVRANDADGATWGTSVVVDDSGAFTVGSDTSLAVVDGNPAISYFHWSNNDLMYVRANDVDGNSWATPIVVDSPGEVGRDTSLTVVNGNPAISYYAWFLGDLKYVRAANSEGSSWNVPITIDSAGDVGQHTTLVVVNGNPAISYHDRGERDLKYVRATDVNGNFWGPPLTIDSFGNVGRFASMAVVSGNAAISYLNSDNNDLMYSRANDASGASWGTPVTVNSFGNVGWYTSLMMVNGYPAISYHNWGNSSLEYVRADNPTMITLETFEVQTKDNSITYLLSGLLVLIGVIWLILRWRYRPLSS